jgi:DNA (cytosine-5)-methyltransferase 1
MPRATRRSDGRTRTAIDLFAGCGGLTLGLKKSGYRVVAAVENNHVAATTYEANHPDARLWPKDIRPLSPRNLMKELSLRKGALDLLAGCPPCQGFSKMKTLNGSRSIRDEQNDLIFDFLRFAEALYPKFILMENVPALAQDYRTARVCERLEALGYAPLVDVLDAADFRVPQRRRRMLLLASRIGRIEFPPPKDTQRTTVRHAIGQLPPPGRSGDELHDLPSHRSPRVMELIIAIPKDGGSRSDLGPERQLACHKRCDGFKDVYGRMKWDDVSPTITSGCINPSKGRFLHPEQDRAITLREAALLQDFTPSYIFPGKFGRYPLAALIGNAVPAEFVVRQVSVFDA